MMRVSIESMEPMGEMCRITRILFTVSDIRVTD